LRIDSIYVLYRVIEWLGLPFIVLYLLLRGLKDKRYFRLIHERLGWLPPAYWQTRQEAIWLHAVSVGEVLCSLELLRSLRAEFPHAPLFVSSATLAGRAIAEQKLQGMVDGIFYAPVDYCFAVRRVLRALRPRVVAVLETEIWPNLYREVKRAGCGLVVVNGRISDRAARRYSAWRWFFRGVLKWPDRILAQNETSRQRFVDAGAPPERVAVTGNLKYDFDPAKATPPEAVRRFLEKARPKAVWIAASTMPPAHQQDVDEDDIVLEAFQKLAASHPGLLLLLVPRKPERFESVAQKLERAGVRFVRRSALTEADDGPVPIVLLVDTIGELSGLFSLADLVFMGGTLAERGGHNILEPAFFGRPIIVGPHMENFSDIAAEYAGAHAYIEIAGGAELAPAVAALLDGEQLRADLGERARDLAEARRGATTAAVEQIRALYIEADPGPWRPWFLMVLSRLWRTGVLWRRRNTKTRRLKTPVISIGGITMGGTGKTPFVVWLGGRLNAAGLCPAILTRGYRRESREIALLEAGADAPLTLTGDEPQILLRAGVAPVGIGPDRFEVGIRMEQHFPCGIFLLDDGFQHWRLERDLDIVLIDALDPFGGGELFPAGRLREPLDALARADIVVLTRTEPGITHGDIVSVLREYNLHARVFASRVVPRFWVAEGAQYPASEPPFAHAAAFCGLANPESFWRTLNALGVRPILQWTFPDHHRYSARELQRMADEAKAAGADALITTEKDSINLCEPPFRLFELRIGLEVDDEEQLLYLIRDRVRVEPRL
jgi:3-deoxy-D-manno-octulosonic-acid transferase